MVGRAEHPLFLGLRRAGTPAHRLLVCASLIGISCLDIIVGIERRFRLEVDAPHRRSSGVRPHEDQVAFRVGRPLFEKEYVVEARVESFGQQVELHLARVAVEIGRQREAVRVLRLEVGIENDQRYVAAYGVDVQVLVVGLRSPVSRRVSRSENHVPYGRIADVSPGTEHRIADPVVLVDARADHEIEPFALPLVLHVASVGAAHLPHVAVVTEHPVVQVVAIVFDAECQVGRREQELVHPVGILRARHKRVVGRFAVGVRIFVRSVVAFPPHVLIRGVHSYFVALVRREEVELKAASVDRVAGLLGDIRFVGRPFEVVSSPAEIVDMVVFESQFGIGSCLVIGAEAGNL